MGLLSIFQRNTQASAKSAKGRNGKPAARQAPLADTLHPADTAEAVREARARARTRLMGATVLLLVGVIGFPLLFETQPRPIPVDLPIEIPPRNAPGLADAGAHAHALAVPPAPARVASGPQPESVSYDARSSAPAAASEPAPEPAPHRSAFASLAAAFTSGPAGSASAPAPAPDASAAVTPAKPAARAEKHAASVAAPVVAVAPAVPASKAPVPHVVLPPPPASTPSPAAILAGTTPSTKPSDAAAGRFIVQVGAFLDDAKVRDTRAKVEKLGMKTYTQPVDTPTGKRIRVRVGPYATRAEADRIAARLKGDGLQAVVLTL